MGNAKGTREERRAAAIARQGFDRDEVRARERRLREIERSLHPVEILTICAAGQSLAEYVEWKAKNDAPTEARKGSDQ
ncbi:MAG: hypothetical protein E6Q97_35745 [Desulfurellales bacterium]|nr:MAG: hypothetical protein E6Q97_35745 [Desulfurellales bacterium]